MLYYPKKKFIWIVIMNCQMWLHLQPHLTKISGALCTRDFSISGAKCIIFKKYFLWAFGKYNSTAMANNYQKHEYPIIVFSVFLLGMMQIKIKTNCAKARLHLSAPHHIQNFFYTKDIWEHNITCNRCVNCRVTFGENKIECCMVWYTYYPWT